MIPPIVKVTVVQDKLPATIKVAGKIFKVKADK